MGKIRLDGCAVRALTITGLSVVLALLAPGGTGRAQSSGRVVFLGSNPWGLFVVDDDTGGANPSYIYAGLPDDPALSPDGRRIVFSIGFNDGQYTKESIFIINVDGSGERRITDPPVKLTPFGLVPWADRHPRWSPDNKTIVFNRFFSADLESVGSPLMSVDVDTPGSETALGPQNAHYPDWSHDGKQIVFNDLQAQVISILNLETHAVTPIRSALGQFSQDQPDWSPDGTRIAFHQSGAQGGIWVMDADGNNAHLVIASLVNQSAEFDHPAWSPDGTRIGFRYWGQGASAIKHIKPDGTEPGTLVEIRAMSTPAFDWGHAPTAPVDADGDGVPDASDNCQGVANADQADADADGIGDACDDDRDGDGAPNATDNCPLTANANQADGDGDGIGDVCDADDDNDGVADGSDNCPALANADQSDADHDGIGDACDADFSRLSIAGGAVDEGNKGSRTLAFQITLSTVRAVDVTVQYATANGTAASPGDYGGVSGVLTIPAGATTGAINVSVKGDTAVEGDETFTVVLNNPLNATISAGSATGTIRNDDLPSANLGIAVSASGTYMAGSQVTYLLTVTNAGPDATQSVTVTDNLPAQLTFVSCSAPGGTCGGAANNRTVAFGSLASGASATITITAAINADVPKGTKITNTADVGAATPDPNMRNNSGAVAITTARK